MHVLLISKSRGKARARVSRLLDSYALRTGDAAWATPITQEALIELRTALRRGASRQTAVACFVNIGRRRLRLAWVVGRAGQFDAQGAVPVAETRRKRKFWVPPWLRRLALLATAGGWQHDVGKASILFQNKLKSPRLLADPIRHEWLSLKVCQRLRDGAGWRAAWDLGGWAGSAMNELPRFAQHGLASGNDVVDFLVVSHHRLFAAPGGKPDSSAYFNSTVAAETAHFQPLAELERATLAQISRGYRRLQVLLAEWPLQPPAAWASALLARVALIFADQTISAKKFSQRCRLYANTTPVGARRQLNQPLDWHLQQVGESAGAAAVAMHHLHGVGLSPDSLAQILAPAAPDSRFVWQNTATHALQRLRENHDGPVLVLNMASTGSGKTRMNAKAACALAQAGTAVRFAVVLNLRSLTLQTGDALATQLQIGRDEMAVVIGDPVVQQLHRQGKVGDEEDIDGNAELERYDADGLDFELPNWLTPWLARWPVQRRLLGAPLLVATIDYLIAAGEPHRQQHHVSAVFRLLSGSDLVIDELDSYDPPALLAVLRLVQMAALCGRSVVASSATLSNTVATALHETFWTGVRLREQLLGTPLPWATMLLSDQAAPQEVREATEFEAAYGAFTRASLAPLADQAPLRLARVWPNLPRGKQRGDAHAFDYWAARAFAGMVALHADHAWQFAGTTSKVSFGLIRVAHIRTAVRLARALADQALQQPATVYKIASYHAMDVLIQRYLKERCLDRLLRRAQGNGGIENDPEIAATVRLAAGRDVVFVVVATPVEEIGRDHDFDWAIIEPSSAQSIVQTAGRVNRHRLVAVDRPNVLIMNFNLKAIEAEPSSKQPVFCRPGFESPDHLYLRDNQHVVEMRHLMAKDFDPNQPFPLDARLRFEAERCQLAGFDDRNLRAYLREPLRILHSVATQPQVALQGEAFYRDYPLRDAKPRQTLLIRPDDADRYVHRWELCRDRWSFRQREYNAHPVIKRHSCDWLCYDLDELATYCQQLGIAAEQGLRLEVALPHEELCSRLCWDRSFGWFIQRRDPRKYQHCSG